MTLPETVIELHHRPSVALTPAQRSRRMLNSNNGGERSHDSIEGSSSVDRPRIGSGTAQEILQHYRSRTRDTNSQSQINLLREQESREWRRQDRTTLAQIRRHMDNRDSLFWKLCRPISNTVTFPVGDEHLTQLIKRTFLPRMEIPVLVCDITADTASITQSQIKNIEHIWKTKPADVVVRWIHAPVGTGLLHSSLEDMFRHDGHPGKPFRHAGYPGFPYLEVESLHFRETEELQHMDKVIRTLRPLEELKKSLGGVSFSGDRNDSLLDDFNWRLKELGKSEDFWELVLSDFPQELAEGLAIDGPLRSLKSDEGFSDLSSIGETNPQFSGVSLVAAPFRCFHREDGVLLTMSAATGVDQIDIGFEQHVRAPLHSRMTNPRSSTVYNQMMSLIDKGTSSWGQKNVEWFTVFLLTEISVMPSNAHSGGAAPSLSSALQRTVLDLKRKRYDTYAPGQSVILVKEFLACIDQLHTLLAAYERKLVFLDKLQQDVEDGALQHALESRMSNTSSRDENLALERISWARQSVQDTKGVVEFLKKDLQQALDSLFQLRSIEQSELAVTADSQNKAILIFTSVTVIFLPLSFFTSYWGMNLTGIRDTSKSQRYFWKVFGTTALVAVLLVTLFAFRRRFQRRADNTLRHLIHVSDRKREVLSSQV